MLSALSLIGCAGSLPPFTWADELPPSNAPRLIQAGDTLAVLVKDQVELSGDFPVRSNGTYEQPVVGPVGVAGLTEPQASERLAGLLKGIVVRPKVVVTVAIPRPIKVGVVGEVESGGLFEVAPDESVLSVISQAQGLTPYADEDAIYVVRKRPKVLRVRFRYSDLVGAEPASTAFRLRDGDVIVVE